MIFHEPRVIGVWETTRESHTKCDNRTERDISKLKTRRGGLNCCHSQLRYCPGEDPSAAQFKTHLENEKNIFAVNFFPV